MNCISIRYLIIRKALAVTTRCWYPFKIITYLTLANSHSSIVFSVWSNYNLTLVKRYNALLFKIGNTRLVLSYLHTAHIYIFIQQCDFFQLDKICLECILWHVLYCQPVSSYVNQCEIKWKWLLLLYCFKKFCGIIIGLNSTRQSIVMTKFNFLCLNCIKIWLSRLQFAGGVRF